MDPDSSDPDALNDATLLMQAGCLTIKARASRASLLVGCPNREVSEFMAALCSSLPPRKKDMGEAGAPTPLMHLSDAATTATA